MSHARRFAALGGLLALGAPAGLLAVRMATPSDIAAFAYVAAGTAAAMSLFGWALGRKEDELERLTLVDALTGLGNRRKFDARLAEELARSRRSSSPVSLLMIDIDRFKAVNDRWGHPVGDRILQQVAGVVRDSFRASDVVCRYGGEEIAVIAPETDIAEALVLAERLRKQIERMPIDTVGAAVTVSIGISASRAEDREDVRDLTDRADEALYVAKREGRNRCRTSGPVPALH